MDHTRRRAIIAGVTALAGLATSQALRGMACPIWDPGDPPQDAEGAAIVVRITDVRLCVGCIAALTNVPSRRVAAVLERAQATVRLREERAACGRCARSLTVYGLGLRKPSLSV